MNENDPLDKEISFEGGVRGKFHRPGVVVNLPVYLEAEIFQAFDQIAQRKGREVNDLINEVLRVQLESAAVLR